MDRTFIDRPASESERQRAMEVAQSVLDGRTTVLEAVRELVYLAHTDAIADVEDRRLIIGIESEPIIYLLEKFGGFGHPKHSEKRT
jgi:hypothetical protein